MPDLTSLVNVLRAAGEVTRLRLLTLLAAGELSVKDLTEILGQSQPRVSRHLRLLVEAGLITRHAEGAWAYFGLAENGEGAHLVRRMVAQLDAGDARIAGDRERLEALRAAQREQAAAYFAKVAESWDLLRSLHVPEEAVEAAILEAAGPGTAELLLDLGTGTGRMLELLADRYRRGIGIDSSREMLAVARAKLGAAEIGHAQIRLGDMAELDDYRGMADLIVVHQVLHYFDDPGVMLKAARKALASGGKMIVADFAPHALEFLRTEHAHRRLGLSGEQMAAWARAAELKISNFQDFPGHNGAESLTVALWTLEDASRPAKRGNAEDG